MTRGFVLADVPQRVSWRALVAMLRHSPRQSAVGQTVGGEKAFWGDLEHLVARALDQLQFLAWSKSEDARTGRNRPALVPHPGYEMPQDEKQTRYGNAAMSIEETKKWLGW